MLFLTPNQQFQSTDSESVKGERPEGEQHYENEINGQPFSMKGTKLNVKQTAGTTAQINW